MQTFTAHEAQARFHELLDCVQREPVQLVQHSRIVGVMVSVEDCKQMRRFYAERLRHTLRQSAHDAEAKELTEETLAQLLSNDH